MDKKVAQADNVRTAMFEQYKIEYRNKELTAELQNTMQQFCFSCVLSEFGIKLSSEQITQMFSILTTEQLESINTQLIDGKSWY